MLHTENCGQIREYFTFLLMSQKQSPSRVIALVTLASLALQLFSPLFEITFADNTAYYVDAT